MREPSIKLATILVIPVFMLLGLGFYLLLLKPISDRPPHELLVASILVTLGAYPRKARAVRDQTLQWIHDLFPILEKRKKQKTIPFRVVNSRWRPLDGASWQSLYF